MFTLCNNLIFGLLQKKVGEYFKPEETLDFVGYLVGVTNRISLPFCTLSTLEVSACNMFYMKRSVSREYASTVQGIKHAERYEHPIVS